MTNNDDLQAATSAPVAAADTEPTDQGEGRLQLLAFSRSSPRCVVDDLVIIACDSRTTIDGIREQFPDLPRGSVLVIDLDGTDLSTRWLARFGNWG